MTAPLLKPLPDQTVLATEADCIEADLANLRWKQSGGPARDNQARAEKLQSQWEPAMRAAGWWL